jgi:hypothetical protein
MQTTCVWLDGVADTVSEKYLFEQFYRHGNVTSTYIDRKTSRGLVFFESVEQAQRAVTAMRGVPIKDKIIQVNGSTCIFIVMGCVCSVCIFTCRYFSLF